jgi:hypothetical protein
LPHAKIIEKRQKKKDVKQPEKGQKRNLQYPLFVDTPNWIFISGPGCMGTLKNLVKNHGN